MSASTNPQKLTFLARGKVTPWLTCHVSLRVNGETDLAELSDLLVVAGLLAVELVRGETDDLEAAVVVVLVQLLKASVLLSACVRTLLVVPGG